MQSPGGHASLLSAIGAPFQDRNFRRVIVFMGSWNVASNLAAPFLAVYLLRQLGYPLSTVTSAPSDLNRSAAALPLNPAPSTAIFWLS